MTTKKRPILFSAPMVRALLNGSKTQTRRAVKLPHQNPLGAWEVFDWGGENGGRDKHENTAPAQQTMSHTRTGDIIACPYGQPGDRLWVREAWRAPGEFDDVKPLDLKAPAVGRLGTPIIREASRHESVRFGKLRPGIHMPRWASRITLEITGIRVERLQDISEADAIAEGLTASKYAGLDRANARTYSVLWESINGVGSWDANPWVWVIEFKRVQS